MSAAVRNRWSNDAPPSPGWPSAEVDALKAMYRRGETASQIAKALFAQFRTSRSRNSVIGKIHRLIDAGELEKLVRLAPNTSISPARKPDKPLPRQIVPKPPKPELKVVERPSAPEPLAPFLPPDPVGDRPGVRLEDLGPRQCRYAVTPHMALEHLFCGAPTEPGRSYCEPCADKARSKVQPAPKKKTPDLRYPGERARVRW
jgi:GcrA cell cycle regulator